MRVAVYNRFWSTAGGGEKVAAGIAEVLARGHDVTLLSTEPIELAWLGERLQVDLSGVAVEILDGREPAAVALASEAYDLLVNASYTSHDPSHAAHGIYFVHFPSDPAFLPSLPRRALLSVTARAARALDVDLAGYHWRRGVYASESVGVLGRRIRRAVRWTNGEAELELRLPPREETRVELLLARLVPPGGAPVPAQVFLEGELAAETELRPPRSKLDRRPARLAFTAAAPASGRVRVELRSPAWAPAEAGGGADERRLGVPVIDVVVGGRRAHTLAALNRQVAYPGQSLEFLETYDRVVSNSEYTRSWVRELWGRDTGVLNPPVTPQPREAKTNTILSVGRFFDRTGGHSKKQLELVGAFRRLVERGVTGWTYHLVGGCAPKDRAYLDEVRGAAEGLPVELHVDAEGAELRRLYGQAAIYWHATGLGEDDRLHPERFEHFGITTAEAMSAGAVPVVIGRAGQLEMLRDGIEGFHFADLDQLVARTETLVRNPALRSRMADAAALRAADYGPAAFAERLEALVADATRAARR
ncbi:MAG: glycosyltransferase family 4 protein [Acidimicrobiales bacterium]